VAQKSDPSHTQPSLDNGKEEAEQREGSTGCCDSLANQFSPSSCTHRPITSSTTLPHNKSSCHEEDDGQTVFPFCNRTDGSDPKLKRLCCRRCTALLSPQIGHVITRLAESNGAKSDEMLEVECHHCGTKRRFNISPEFTLYTEREPVEAVQIH
jgi:hypothetical protein